MKLAAQRTEGYDDLLKSIRGFVFLAVPRCGTAIAYWAGFPEQFIQQAAPLKIRTFYETQKLVARQVVDEQIVDE
ncbi:MAG: hypothetical protein M1840_001892 [Geoglossum simile]|nr:MAG: hypothetical protein M1840_001892 [Geoglossum simile]